MKELVLTAACLLMCVTLCGQRMSDEYELEYASVEDFRAVISDTYLLWAPPGDGISVFSRLSKYNFSFISYRDRGLDGRYAGYYLGNLDISGLTGKYPDYSFYGTLRVAAPYLSEKTGAASGAYGPGGAAGVTEYGLRISRARTGLSLRLNYSEQRYRGGGRLSYAADLGKGWYVMAGGQYRAGRDKFIGGVFTDSYIVSAGVEKDLGGAGSLSLIYVRADSERGMRSWSVQEAFGLTGDNLYNPVSGDWGGKERNARVRRDRDDIAAMNYTLGRRNTNVNISAMYRSAERGRSGLSWWGARNPWPDHYTNLPGYFSDPELAREMGNKWREEESMRLVDWQSLRDINENVAAQAGGAVYLINESVEDIRSLQAAVSASTRLSKEFTLDYGLRGGRDKSNFYKRVKDLIGAEYRLDTDEYDTDVANDIRDPGRTVRKGDRFGYDYDISRSRATAFAMGAYERGRWSLGFGAEVTFSSLYREGHNEKGSFPGTKSLGKSEKLNFTSYNFKLSGRYSLSPQHHLTAAAFVTEREQAYENVFLSPAVHNITVDDPGTVFLSGGEISYSGFVTPSIEVGVSAYYTATSDETEVYRYYDDILDGYSLMPLRDIGKRFMGVEAGVKIDITPRLRFMAGVSLNEYKYASDPVADIYRDRDMKRSVSNVVSQMEGYVCSPSPQRMAAASLRYSIPYSWSFEATAVYAAARYVQANPLRRMDRIAAVASSPESMLEFRSQERLPDAAVVNLFISKRFRLFGNDMFAGLAVNNLLGRKDMVYGGYEQMRIRGEGNGINRTFTPFPSKYAYCYPRSFLLTVILNF